MFNLNMSFVLDMRSVSFGKLMHFYWPVSLCGHANVDVDDVFIPTYISRYEADSCTETDRVMGIEADSPLCLQGHFRMPH